MATQINKRLTLHDNANEDANHSDVDSSDGQGAFDPMQECAASEIPVSRDVAVRSDLSGSEVASEEESHVFRDLIEKSLQPMYVREGMRIVFANQAMADLLEYDNVEELLNIDDVYCIIAEDALHRAADLLARSADDSSVTIWHPITLKSKDGQPIAVEAYRRSIKWQGKQSSFLVYRDVRVETEALQALAASESRLCAILDACGQGILVHENGKPLYANPALRVLFGHQADSPLEELRNVFDYMPVSDELRRVAKRQLSDGEILMKYETLIRTVDGRDRLLEVMAQPINWDGCEAVLATMVDITTRKQAELELRLSEERFRDYAQTAANWFWETDENYCLVNLSDEFEEITGIPIAKRIGRRLLDDTFDKIPSGKKNIERLWDVMTEHKPFRNVDFNRYATNGERVTIQISGVPVFDADGDFVGYRGSSRDVTAERKMQEKIEHDATHDELTGLPNRRRFAELLEKSIERVKRYGGSDLLVFVDLDGFKIVNDTAGHSVGDKLLTQCAKVFTRLLSPGDVVCRLGGDEFGFLIRSLKPTDASPLLEKIIDTISTNHFFHEGQSFSVGLSAGAVAIEGDGHTREQLLSQADLACYAAKELGRNRVYYFRESDIDARRRQREMRTAAHLREAISQDRLTLYGQAIVSLTDPSNPVDHYEILVRLLDKDGSIIAPDAFIPAAERYQLMDVIDRWVVSQALRQLVDAGFLSSHDDIRVSINLSGGSLGDPTMAAYICEEISRWQVDPQRLCFEITETAAIQNMDTALALIERLKNLGCRFSLDDFGTGLSSFSYLQNLLVDELKIDGSFVQQLQDNPVNKAVVTAVCDVGKSLGMSIVAERVEDKETADALKRLGVTMGQGYFWSRPAPLEQMFVEHANRTSARVSSPAGNTPDLARVVQLKP